MARVDGETAYGWGQAQAALHVIEGVATGKVVRAARLEETTDRPRSSLKNLLRLAGPQLLVALEKGGDHARAVEALFGDVLRRIPPGRMHDKNLGRDEAADFRRGYEEQLALYRERWGELLVGPGR